MKMHLPGSPLSRSVKETGNSEDNTTGLAFLESMAVGFKDVQVCYNRRWDKIEAVRQAVELTEKKLDERFEDTRKWYEGKLQSIKGEEEKHDAAKREEAPLGNRLFEREA